MYSVVFLSKYLFTKYLKKMSYREVCFSEMEQTFSDGIPMRGTSGLELNPPKESVLKKSSPLQS